MLARTEHCLWKNSKGEKFYMQTGIHTLFKSGFVQLGKFSAQLVMWLFSLDADPYNDFGKTGSCWRNYVSRILDFGS